MGLGERRGRGPGRGRFARTIGGRLIGIRAGAGVAAAAVLLLSAGCFSVQSRYRPETDGDRTTGGVALRVYADDEARRQNLPGPRGLFVELERRADRANEWEPVFRSLEPAWSVQGLPPGEYRLRFPSRLDETGEEVALDERPRKIRVRAGEVTEVDAVLEHVDKGLIVAGVVAAVVAAVLLDDWLDDVDLPLPPPPPPALVDAVFWISLDVAAAAAYGPGPWSTAGGSRPPVVTSTFPPDGALVAVDRLRVTFSLSGPIDPERFASDCVEVVGDLTGPVAGSARYDDVRWWIHWYPEADLPRDDDLEVTLFASCVSDRHGGTFEADEAFRFRTAP